MNQETIQLFPSPESEASEVYAPNDAKDVHLTKDGALKFRYKDVSYELKFSTP